MTRICYMLVKSIKTESLVMQKPPKYPSTQEIQDLCAERIEGAHSKQECSQNTEPPILLQPPFQHVHHVSRFNPTVPHPQANRILSQSIMFNCKRTCSSLGKLWEDPAGPRQGFRPHPQCHCKLQGRREERRLLPPGLRNAGCARSLVGGRGWRFFK